jgi:hypothetical protein
MAEALNAGWLRKLHASVNAPPLQPRVPLWAGESIIGSVEPDFLSQKSLQPLFILIPIRNTINYPIPSGN